MNDMQRYGYCSTCVCPLPKDDGRWVLLADAEAAVAAARHQEAQVHSSTERWSPLSHLQGQRDMLAKCIEAVEAVDGGYSIPLGMCVGAFIDAMRHQFVAALRDLREKP